VTFDPPVGGYDGAHIHYQFHTSQRNASDPVVAWHTGGPGGSSIYGQYAEAGYFQVYTSAGQTVNPSSWNNVANMLYLEAPAGSFLTPVDEHSGFSYCTAGGGVRQTTCSWNDVTQAQAYGQAPADASGIGPGVTSQAQADAQKQAANAQMLAVLIPQFMACQGTPAAAPFAASIVAYGGPNLLAPTPCRTRRSLPRPAACKRNEEQVEQR
jgi:hypothetical protein